MEETDLASSKHGVCVHVPIVSNKTIKHKPRIYFFEARAPRLVLPEDNVVNDTELQIGEFREGGLGQVEPVGVVARSAEVAHSDGNSLAVVPEVDLVAALVTRRFGDSSNQVIVTRGRSTARRGLEHVAAVESDASVVATLGVASGSSDGNAKESNEESNEESGTHLVVREGNI